MTKNKQNKNKKQEDPKQGSSNKSNDNSDHVSISRAEYEFLKEMMSSFKQSKADKAKPAAQTKTEEVRPPQPSEPARVPRTFSAHAAAYKPNVPLNMTATRNKLRTLNIEAHLKPETSDTSSHPLSHAVREYLTARAFGYAADFQTGGKRIITTAYGSPRDGRIINVINAGLPEDEQVSLNVFRPITVAADIGRAGESDMFLQCKSETIVGNTILIDVYANGKDKFNPEWFQEHLPLGSVAVWVGHCFLGAAHTVFGEGGWYRDFDRNLIIHRPDEHASNSPGHDPCDWIWTNTTAKLSDDTVLAWSTMMTVKDYRLVVFRRLPVDTVIANSPQLPVIPWQFSDEEAFDMDAAPWYVQTLWSVASERFSMSFWESIVPKRKVLFYEPILTTLCNSAAGRPRGALLYRQLIQQSNSSCQNDDHVKLLQKLFPDRFGKLPEAMAMLALVRGVSGTVMTLNRSVLNKGKVLETHAQTVESIGLPPLTRVDWWRRIQIAVICLVAIRWLYQWFRGPRRAQSTQLVVLEKPINPNMISSAGVLSLPSRASVHSRVDRFYNAIQTKLRCVADRLTGWRDRLLDWIKGLSFFGAIPYLKRAYAARQERMWKQMRTQPFYADLSREEVPAFQLRLFKQAVLFHPPVEEMVKHAIGKWGYLFGLVEFLFKACTQPFTWRMLLPLPMHIVTAWMSLPQAIIVHALWNFCAIYVLPIPRDALGMFRLQQGSLPYAAFREAFYLRSWEDRPPVELWEGSYLQPFDPELSATPTQQSHCSLKPLDTTLVMKGSLPLPGRDVNSYYYWFLPTNCPGYVPKRSDENLLSVLRNRILAAPPMSPALQKEHWDQSRMPILVEPEAPITWEDEKEAWLAHFDDPARKRRYRLAMEYHLAHGVNYDASEWHRIEMMVKIDECLLKVEEDPTNPLCHRVMMKPRAIANVSPKVQVVLGPYIWKATKSLRAQWCIIPRPVERAGRLVFITYGGAATDRDLSDWVNFALFPKSNAVHILVSGDDSLVIVWSETSNISVYEGDFGMFDQSQSVGPLTFEYAVLKRLGVPHDIVERMEGLAHATYLFRTRDKRSSAEVRVDLTRRPMRHTGGTDTTFGNTVVNAHAMAWAFTEYPDSPVSGLKYLGFDVKMKRYGSISEATFLKGRWYATKDTQYPRYWGPLPSRILKVGKAMKDVRLLYRKDLESSAKEFLQDVAWSYKAFMQVPLLRVFVSRFSRDTPPRIPVPFAHWKIQASGLPTPEVDMEMTLAELGLRYTVPPVWFTELEFIWPYHPFRFVVHPLCPVLAQVDYS